MSPQPPRPFAFMGRTWALALYLAGAGPDPGWLGLVIQEALAELVMFSSSHPDQQAKTSQREEAKNAFCPCNAVTGFPLSFRGAEERG